MSRAHVEAAPSIWERCYVCDSPVLAEGHGPHSPLCAAHMAARDHIISNQNDKIVCRCGWERWVATFDHARRDRACRMHWRDVSEQAA